MRKISRNICLLTAVLLSLTQINIAAAQQFSNSGETFPGLYAGSAHWINNQTLTSVNLALTGLKDTGDPVTLLYTFSGGIPSEITHSVTGVYFGSAVWGDYDNDGDADLAVLGLDADGNSVAEIWKNNAGVFALDIEQYDLTGLRYSSAAWGDYNNDGLIDLLTTGMTDLGVTRTILYKNTRAEGISKFILIEESFHPFLNIAKGSAVFGDYDDDGDLDIVLSGVDAGGFANAKVFKNDPVGVFTEDLENSGIMQKLTSGKLVFGDADAYGDLDLLQTGLNSRWESVIILHENEPTGRFRDNLLSTAQDLAGPAAWGDFDIDGDYDITAAGKDQYSVIYGILLTQQPNNSFTENSGEFAALRDGALAVGDYDLDGRPDLIISGVNSTGGYETVLYHNATSQLKVTPGPPQSLDPVIITNDRMIFRWDNGSDLTTPVEMLTYNIRIGSKDDATKKNEVYSAVVSAGPGNMGNSLSLDLSTRLSVGEYSWSVQTVNAQFVRSAWSQEEILRVEHYVSSLQSVSGFTEAASAWADYDGDGDFDLVIAGKNSNGINQALLYKNNDGKLTRDDNNSLIKFNSGDFAWGDVDNDGDPDLAYSGFFIRQSPTSGLYINNNGILTEKEGVFAQLGFASLDWGDYDGDGDLDLAIMGKENSGAFVTKIYKNVGGSLIEDTSQTIMGYANGTLKWADYDNDGDLDLSITGQSANLDNKTRIYKNDPTGTLTEDTGNALPAFQSSDLAWADIDDDGDIDLVISGYHDLSGTAKTLVFVNDPVGTLTEDAALSAGIHGAYGGSISFGDYDNDGDPDLVVSGSDGTVSTLELYENKTTSFAEEPLRIFDGRGVDFSTISFIDIDDDGDLELFAAGRSFDGQNVSISAMMFDNVISGSNPNQAPQVPAGLNSVVDHSTGSIILSWNAALDPPLNDPLRDFVTYQVRVGTTVGGSEIISDAVVPGIGKFGSYLTRVITDLKSNDYYWSVRSVDNGLKPSSWAQDESFYIDIDPPTVNSNLVNISPDSASSGAVTIILDISENYALNYAVTPTVSVSLDDSTQLTVDMITYLGNIWVGELNLNQEYPNGVVTLSVSGITDAVGNLMAPVDNVKTFYLNTQRAPYINAGELTVTPEFSGVGTVTLILPIIENFTLNHSILPDITFKLSDNTTASPDMISYDGKTWIGEFDVLETFPNGEVVIGIAGITDAAGNVMTPVDAIKSFTIDTQRPQVLTVDPPVVEDGIISGIKTNVMVSATFSEPVDSASVTSDVMKLFEGATEVTPSQAVRSSPDNMSISAFYTNLKSATVYRAVVEGKVYDRAGNRMEVSYSWQFKTAFIVSAGNGGDVFNADSSLSLYFSPSALQNDLEIPITAFTPSSTPSIGDNVTFLDIAYRIGPEEATTLDKPAKLVFKYDDSDLGGGVNASKIAIYKQTGNGAADWTKIGGTVDTGAKTVTASISSLGVFGLFEDLKTVAGADGITELSFSPRVFGPKGSGFLAKETSINFVLGNNMDVTILIFNSSRRLIRRLFDSRPMNAGNQSVMWDGTDADGNVLPSGLYIVAIQSGGITEYKTVGISNR